MNRNNLLQTLLVLVFVSALPSCLEEYDAPPEVSLNLPETGTFFIGDTLTLTFSEDVKLSTLKVRVWPGERDIEGNLTSSTPLTDICRVDKECEGLSFTSDGKTSATIDLPEDGLGQPDVPLVLEVLEGLEDVGGGETGTSLFFDFQFKPEGGGPSGDPIEFRDGIYVLVASISDPLPANLRLISEIKVLEDGELRLVATEANALGDAAPNTNNPDELQIDDEETGFVIHKSGWVRLSNEERFLETDPLDISITPLAGITVTLFDARIAGKVEPNADGEDEIRATLSFSSVTLDTGGTPLEYDGGNTPITGVPISIDEVNGEMARLCGDLCGSVPVQCSPPSDWPGDAFCEEE